MMGQGPDPLDRNPPASAAADPGRPSAPESAAATGADKDLAQELRLAQARAAENYDQFVRAKAETENVRRRAQEDLAKAHKYAVESFAEALVPVMDSLEKAVQNATDAGGLRAGVELTLRQLRSAFEKHRMVEINPAGERFDPHRHQAISMVVVADGTTPPNHVVEVLQKGWMIADRVLRPALVTVAQPQANP
jgi:molecular chaperone GrpE